MNPMTKKQEPEIETETADTDADEVAGEYAEMDEEDFEEFLTQALEDFADDNDLPRMRISTYEQAGLLTRNHGLVVQIGDGEYQLQIVRSR